MRREREREKLYPPNVFYIHMFPAPEKATHIQSTTIDSVFDANRLSKYQRNVPLSIHFIFFSRIFLLFTMALAFGKSTITLPAVRLRSNCIGLNNNLCSDDRENTICQPFIYLFCFLAANIFSFSIVSMFDSSEEKKTTI